MKRTIVCLCGSTRFCADEYRNARGLTPWQQANLDETLAGRIVLSIGVDTKSDTGLEITEAIKADLDQLHLDKIALADEILVINVNGYIGLSTSREIAFAAQAGKGIRFLEDKNQAEERNWQIVCSPDLSIDSSDPANWEVLVDYLTQREAQGPRLQFWERSLRGTRIGVVIQARRRPI